MKEIEVDYDEFEDNYDDCFNEYSQWLIDYILDNMMFIEAYTIVYKYGIIGMFETCVYDDDNDIYVMTIITEDFLLVITFNTFNYEIMIDQSYLYPNEEPQEYILNTKYYISKAKVFHYIMKYIKESTKRVIIPCEEINHLALRKLYDFHFSMD